MDRVALLTIKRIYIVVIRGARTLGIVDDRRWGAGIRALHAGGRPGPAVAAFEEQIASLEGGIGAVATSSRQAAELLTCTALTAAGDHLVAGAALDGSIHALQDAPLRRPGMDKTFVPAGRPEAFAAAKRPAAKAFPHTGAVRGSVFGVAARNLSQVFWPA
jgi:Cys/Met metabolism PLP-dependent enzyme